jgi:putative peptidoglycan lipid II flippase
VAWNLVIIGCLVGLQPFLSDSNQIYAYAIGVLAGTVVQLLLPLPWLRGRGGRFTLNFDWRNPYVIRVLKLMLPVTIALGLINFSLLINSFFGTLVQQEAPAAIDKAFRIYMLPQGLFSVAIATILFPTMSRLAARGDMDGLRRTMANGTRQVLMLLIPSAAIMAVLAVPITRLVYQRGHFGSEATHLVSDAMFWWAFSLPAQGASLLFSRTFFSLQRPWATTALSGANLVVNAIVAAALYKPLGIAGIVIGTAIGTVGMSTAQAFILRSHIGGIDGRQTVSAVGRMLIATALQCVVTWGVWKVLDQAVGRSLAAQVVSVGVAITAGLVVYGAGVWALRVPEAKQIGGLLAGRFRRRAG